MMEMDLCWVWAVLSSINIMYSALQYGVRSTNYYIDNDIDNSNM